MLSDRVAIVTGAAAGIGQTIAEELKSQDAKVVFADKMITVQEMPDANTLRIPCDVSNSESCETLINTTLDKFGRIDILINNAGITRDNLLIRMKNEDWDLVLDINLKGIFYCTRAAAKVMMKQRSGVIINMASVVGQMGNAGQVNYAASKAGVIGLTKSVAKELASRNVRVNAIAPGFIKTRMTDVLSEDVKKQLLAHIPLGRLGEPKDIAKIISFLVSDDAAYITGQVFRVDGGMVM